MAEPDWQDIAAFAGALADAAAAITLAHFRTARAVDDKADGGRPFDPVTEADRGAEQTIRAMIAVRYPGHGIVGEEFGATAGDGDFTWVLDPIDGTKSFVTGVPLWGTLIGLQYRGRAVLGIIDHAYTGERLIAGPGFGRIVTRQGRERLAASGCGSLATARLGTTSPLLFSPGHEREAFARVESQVRLSRYGGDCYFYGLVASGQMDLVVEAGLKPHDIVAIIPIVEAAGGVITTWDGGDASQGGRIVAAASPALHQAARDVLTKATGG